MKNVVVTGATGFIGFNLIKTLLNYDFNITAIVRKDSSKIEKLQQFQNLNIIELNMDEIEKLPDIVDYKCDIFYHFAWDGTRGTTRDDFKLQNANYLYSIRTLESAYKMGCKCFISAGSQAEYGLHDGQTTEKTKCVPNTEYGKAKLKFYLFLKKFATANQFRYLEPRFFSLYGIGDYENTLIMSVIDKMKKNEEINLTECTQLWNYLHISDAVDSLIKLQESDFCGIYNIGSDDTRLLKEFIEEIKEISKSKSAINYGIVSYPLSGKINIYPSIEKLKKDINWTSQINFEQGILEIIHNGKK